MMVFIGIAGLVFLSDYLLKKKAEEKLKQNVVREVAMDKILLRKLHNPGIAFGLFKNNKNVTVLGTAILLGGMCAQFLAVLFQKGKVVSKLGYALLLGGGLNNLYERYHQGYVTDYFSFNVKCEKLRRLVFNLSDMFILIGGVLVCIGKLSHKKKM